MNKLTSAGLELIKHFEGLHLDAYLDPVGIVTIGYGHTQLPYARMGVSITREQAVDLLVQDLKDAERGVRRHVKVLLSDDMYSALVSFTFNLGVGRLATSTLLKKLNVSDYDGAAAQLPRWNKAGGKVLPGLTRRRASEFHLWKTGVFEPNPPDPRSYVQKFTDGGRQLFLGGLY